MKKIYYIFLSLRPRHWVKNLFVFVAAFFSLKLFQPEAFFMSVYGFLCWCLIASGLYIFNDIIDREQDVLHPLKKSRPLANGKFSLFQAFAVFALLSIISLIYSFKLNIAFFMCILAYFLINIAYSLYLKHVFILDVMCVAAGFVLRVASGAALIHVELSEWVIMCTLLLSLLLGFGKRQEEITLLEGRAADHRKVLKEYDEKFLERIPYAIVAATLLCYMLYTVSQETVNRFGTKNLIYTAPFVIYGLMRYVYVAYEKKKGADPTQVLFSDIPTVVNIVAWLIAFGIIIYV